MFSTVPVSLTGAGGFSFPTQTVIMSSVNDTTEKNKTGRYRERLRVRINQDQEKQEQRKRKRNDSDIGGGKKKQRNQEPNVTKYLLAVPVIGDKNLAVAAWTDYYVLGEEHVKKASDICSRSPIYQEQVQEFIKSLRAENVKTISLSEVCTLGQCIVFEMNAGWYW